jgi:hypothetical protein
MAQASSKLTSDQARQLLKALADPLRLQVTGQATITRLGPAARK